MTTLNNSKAKQYENESKKNNQKTQIGSPQLQNKTKGTDFKINSTT
jgi:hypothetical protein